MGPKIASSGNLAPRASWEPPGLDFQAFWGSFWGSQIGRKNGTKNELILGPVPGVARGGQELRFNPPRVVTGRFGGPGGDYRGGYLGSESQISEHQYLSDLVAEDLDTFGRLRP